MLKKLFAFDPSSNSVRTEILAGITTFLTMAYILAVNPDIFGVLESQGMPKNAVFTATALASIVGTLIMAFYAKKPYGLAPGMGLNAFFVYTICISMGYNWQFALTAILIEGIIFILLSIFKVREIIVDSLPSSLKAAFGAGIGLYIAFIGLKNCGIIVNDESSLVTLGNLTDTTTLLALIGILITGSLVVSGIKGGLLWGIIATTIIGIPMGVTQFSGVVSTPPSIAPIFCKFEWHNIFTWDMLIVVFTFLFIDMFDTIGTVVGVSIKTNMIDQDGKVNGIGRMLMADAIATTVGSLLGASTTTTYVESAAGVSVGGRSGLTAFVIACCFAISLFLSPIFLAIPTAATGPALIIVGVMLSSSITKIKWDDYSEAIPSFITLIMIPLSTSISDGIMLGVIAYVILNAVTGIDRIGKISLTMWILAIVFVIRYIMKFSI